MVCYGSYGAADGREHADANSFGRVRKDVHETLCSQRERSDDDADDEYCLTGYGEMSTDEPFTLPPSPTQTIKYRYRAYRPKLARIHKKYRAAANGGTGKTKSSAYHKSVSVSRPCLAPSGHGG